MTTDLLANGLSAVFGTSTSVTSSHKVPFFNGTTPAGLATMSDLASVLGGVVRTIDYDKNIDYLNGIKDISFRLITVKTGESEGMPFGTSTFLLQTFTTMLDANTPRCVQQAFGAFGVTIGQQKFRVFTSASWSEWY